MQKNANRLAQESSPYLLQHSTNPVNWYPWGNEALQLAQQENKIILVSIGYAACHWCHVMEHESFTNEETAQLMNEHFINIKVDREERPDVDHVFMDALQALTGSGGWPLNIFLTPQGLPFYGGTYFPPVPLHQRPSWNIVLESISQNFKNDPETITEQANKLADYLKKSNQNFEKIPAANWEDQAAIAKELAHSVQELISHADAVHGGFGPAPKFPQFFLLQYLFRYHAVWQNNSKYGSLANAGLGQAIFTLNKMLQGGIYDHLEGGMARYSTDEEWLVPHFEKMLYDNAMLITTLSEAWQITANETYAQAIHHTMQFIKNNLLHEQVAFYASLDADSEGEEGTYYVWQKAEIDEILGEKSSLFCKYYQVTTQGNWEGKNILREQKSLAEFALQEQMEETVLASLLHECKQILLAIRNSRPKPALDDKILLSWNALMNMACCHAYVATSNTEYLDLAIKNMDFLLENFSGEEKNRLYHVYKNGKATTDAFLEDYAYLIKALIILYETTAQEKYLEFAIEYTNYVGENFCTNTSSYFSFNHKNNNQLLLNKVDLYDNAMPSSNAMMAYNLHHLGLYINENEWVQKASISIGSIGKIAMQYPSAFGIWASLYLELFYQTPQITLEGNNTSTLHKELLQSFLPFKVVFCLENVEKTKLFIHKLTNTKSSKAYICKNFTCYHPIKTVNEIINQLLGLNPANNFNTIQ